MKLKTKLFGGILLIFLSISSLNAQEPYLGEIRMFAGNFAPRGWAFCDGQLLPISSNSALFSLLGTMYGGDGRTTFALPDLRGRIALHSGHGPGLSNITQGSKGGRENVTLTTLELPSHNHTANNLKGTITANEEDADSEEPQGKTIGVTGEIGNFYNSSPNSVNMMPNSVNISGSTENTGGNRSFNIRNPYQGIRFIIALQGIYPSRS